MSPCPRNSSLLLVATSQPALLTLRSCSSSFLVQHGRLTRLHHKFPRRLSDYPGPRRDFYRQRQHIVGRITFCSEHIIYSLRAAIRHLRVASLLPELPTLFPRPRSTRQWRPSCLRPREYLPTFPMGANSLRERSRAPTTLLWPRCLQHGLATTGACPQHTRPATSCMGVTHSIHKTSRHHGHG